MIGGSWWLSVGKYSYVMNFRSSSMKLNPKQKGKKKERLIKFFIFQKERKRKKERRHAGKNCGRMKW
ncbi:hypothetical protein, partial [Staphylococcus nepalensis]|uniref:hypothetical protein n=1 Tax=Staphylococcus nepalensis TaxID=214473 RepID=UPI00285D5B9F